VSPSETRRPSVGEINRVLDAITGSGIQNAIVEPVGHAPKARPQLNPTPSVRSTVRSDGQPRLGRTTTCDGLIFP
jgi:hypothetical protein